MSRINFGVIFREIEVTGRQFEKVLFQEDDRQAWESVCVCVCVSDGGGAILKAKTHCLNKLEVAPL